MLDNDVVQDEEVSQSESLAESVFSKARLSRDPRFDGRFFVAVKTTGIFCRPICPARLPKEENVTYFEHATQAMAQGYRPCFRCRPDSAPHSAAWKGVGATVSRALSLLSAIPIESVADIACRLGISERYLNKLVVNAVGISPKQFQNMQRALFAKQLIQQTHLSMTDVSVTAGYQSLRQLQRAVEQYCGASPTKLRKKQDTEHKSISLFLAYRPPYNWSYVRDFLAARAIEGMERVTKNSYQRYFSSQSSVGVFKAEHDEARNGFNVHIDMLDLGALHTVIENIKLVLDLLADPLLIEQSLLQAGLSQEQLTSGLRLPSAWSVFESGCRAIVGQQVSVKAAIGQVTLLVHQLGERVPSVMSSHGFGTEVSEHYSFPTPEAVVANNLEFLRMPQARKNALRSFAQLFVGDSMPAHEDILAIKGVGPWTLDYLKMRGERNPDIYLDGDLIVRKVAQQYPIEPNKAAPWRSYLTLQLWQLSNQQKES
ncbi:DNA-3-methyladenine glycosylase 2 family protein [Alteromonas sp. BL110]|uniref:DNA-3-methyladenine glycosylase 2 family protein n=1 Tax=Alteromonas sp. BL110 TaxID=1714845 RepID=UPI000E4C9135|nr:Ada metal-binding domain-containing protein [Alteromonas sp. BL110]AXT38708.1 DNA-3-methyladenine glycosylase 2 family protein [Alteromonas sp. BL110]RKM83142.1 helix-turn-helix domain-containing protein [Alteromonas sp. BL110]